MENKTKLFVEWHDYLENYIKEINKLNEPDVLGRLGLGLMDPKSQELNKYNAVIFKGGEVKAKLVCNHINLLRNIPDDLDGKTDEEITAFLSDYFQKINQEITKEKN